MRIDGINCEYKKVYDYIYLSSCDNPTVSTEARKTLIRDINSFTDLFFPIKQKEEEMLIDEARGKTPDYNKINSRLRNLTVAYKCVYEFVNEDLLSAKVFFDTKNFIKEFKRDFFSDRALNILLGVYAYIKIPNFNLKNTFFNVLNSIEKTFNVQQFYNNGAYYGNINFQQDTRHGKGTYSFKNEDKYIGDWQNGQKHGQGEYFYNNNSNYKHYTGSWHNNERCGNGKLIYSNGTKYIGNFRNNELHGFGEIFYINGDHYVGIWENGTREHLGHYTFADGDYYIGEFKNNKFNGFGVLRYTGLFKVKTIAGYFEDNSQTDITCTWVEGKRTRDSDDGVFYREFANGMGVYFYRKPDGTLYGLSISENLIVGEFYDNSYYDFAETTMEGYGCYILSNHDYFIGNHSNDQKHGHGCYFFKNGESEVGEWRNGQKYNTKTYGVDGKIKQ